MTNQSKNGITPYLSETNGFYLSQAIKLKSGQRLLHVELYKLCSEHVEGAHEDEIALVINS
jgi:hypothetical protein